MSLLMGFRLFSEQASGTPLVTVKIATTLDGRIALADGTSQWITGAAARRLVHEMRSRHDVVTSSGTLIADDPLLTVKGSGIASQPLRVAVTGANVLKAEHQLVQSVTEDLSGASAPKKGWPACRKG